MTPFLGAWALRSPRREAAGLPGQTGTSCVRWPVYVGAMAPPLSAAPSACLDQAPALCPPLGMVENGQEAPAFGSKLFQSRKSKVGPGYMFEKEQRVERHTHTKEKEVQARLSHLRPRNVSQQTSDILLCQHSNSGAWTRQLELNVNRRTTSSSLPGPPCAHSPRPTCHRERGAGPLGRLRRQM